MLFSQMLMAWSYISLQRRRWAQKSLFRMLIRKWRYNKGYSVWVGVQYGGTSSLGLCARSLSSWPNARWLANRAPSLEGKRGTDRSDYKIKGIDSKTGLDKASALEADTPMVGREGKCPGIQRLVAWLDPLSTKKEKGFQQRCSFSIDLLTGIPSFLSEVPLWTRQKKKSEVLLLRSERRERNSAVVATT